MTRDIENLIQNGFLNKFVVHHKRTRSPREGDRNASPLKGQQHMRTTNGTFNVLSRDFASGGETSGAREVYASQISVTALVGKRSREVGEVFISFFGSEMEHVTFPHEEFLVITSEIDGYDVKWLLIDSGSSTNVLFLDSLKKMGRSEKDLKEVNF